MAKILIADDSKFMRKMLTDILTAEGHQIIGESENARETIELYKKLKPDLLTLDIIMPLVEGIETLSALKAIIEENPQAKVVMVSALGQEDVVEECIQAGAKAFIIKPFKSSKVAEVANDVLKA